MAAAAYARFAFAGYAETGSVVDAGRNLDLQLLADLDRAVAVALRALLLDDLARAAAVRAGADVDHLAEGRVLDDALLARAVADGACFYVAARFGAAAVAAVARFILRDLDFHFRAEGGLLKGNIHVEAQVCAALRAVCRLAASLAAEEIGEDVFKAAEPAALTESAKAAEPTEAACARTAGAAVFKGGVAELVVLGALVLIGQDLVGFVDFLKLFFGSFGVVPVFIRMVFDG